MKTFWRYLPLLLLALAWEAIARLEIVSSSALPPLTSVIASWFELMQSGELITNGASSLYRAAAGLGLSIVIGAILGIVMAWWRPVNALLSPIVEVFYPMPKSALIPVTVLWLGFGDGSKILLIFLGCMLPVTIGAFNGARSSDQALVWSARSMGANRLRMLWDVVLPSALPELLNGIRTALALSFILLVSSELIVARQGFGYLIGFLGANGSYEPMFAVVLTVALLGFAADRVYQAIVRRAAAMARADLIEPAPARAPLPLSAVLAAVGRFVLPLIVIVGVLVAWEVFARSGLVTPFMLPRLSAVLERIWNDASSGELAINMGLTLYRALVGFLIAAVGGIAARHGDVAQRSASTGCSIRSSRSAFRCPRSPSCRW